MMRTKQYRSIFTVVVSIAGCVQEDETAIGGDWSWDGPVLRGGTVHTLNSNGDKKLSPGELTTPGPEFDHKETCSQDIILSWRACLMEEDDDGELGSPMCENFETTLECNDYRLSQGDTVCTGGENCEILVPDLGEPGRCGWRITELVATNADTGEELEGIDPEFIEELGFEILPVVSF